MYLVRCLRRTGPLVPADGRLCVAVSYQVTGGSKVWEESFFRRLKRDLLDSETLPPACLRRCSQNTRSRSRSSIAFQLVLIECSETLSQCDWKPPNTSPVACMTSTSSQSTRNFGLEQS